MYTSHSNPSILIHILCLIYPLFVGVIDITVFQNPKDESLKITTTVVIIIAVNIGIIITIYFNNIIKDEPKIIIIKDDIIKRWSFLFDSIFMDDIQYNDELMEMFHDLIIITSQRNNFCDTIKCYIMMKRQIMLIHEYHMANIGNKTKIDSSYIISYENTLRIIYNSIKSLMNNGYYKSFFHVHVSKSGGSSIRFTFKGLQNGNNSVKTCYDENNPKKFNDYSCSSQHNYFVDQQQCQYIRRERPLSRKIKYSLDAYGYPELCDQFIYILPFRDPIEKALSWFTQSNILKSDHKTQWFKVKLFSL